MNRLTVFPCHARQDRPLVRDLADFLERGANLELFVDDGEIRPGETLVSKAADGLQADVILVILSPDSVPARWVLEEWTPALWDQPEDAGVDVAAVLCRDCGFPPLLRRRNFFDLSENRLDGFRAIKQWLLRRRPPPQQVFFAPARPSAFIGRRAELEALRQSLGDAPGLALLAAPAGMGKTALALEFAWRCRGDFEGVFWLHGGRRSAARLAGDLATQVGLRLDGDTEKNLRELLRFCAEKRCLIVFDDVKDDAALLLPGGRSSVLITTERQDLPAPLIRLGPFSLEESLELSGQSLSPELIALLGGIPLAITVAAALGPHGSFEGLAGNDPVRRLLDLAAAATGERGARLLAAMSACAPAGAPVALAAQVAELDESSAFDQIERLQSLSLAASLDPDAARYCLHELVRQAEPTETMARRHARAALGAGLPDIEHAFEWALSQQDDPEVWSLACSLARRAFSLTSRQARLAEADEILQRLFRAAERREDRPVLEECAWERIWILEKWDRLEDARRLQDYRRTVLQDQTCFDFMLEPFSGPAP